MVEQVAHLFERELLDLHQVQQRAGVECAGARAHHQAVERGKAHRGGDALEVAHRAQAGAAAQVRDDGAPARGVAVAFGQRGRHERIRQAVETIAAQAALPGIPRQRQDLLDRRHGVMEAGVETGHLRQLGRLAQQDLDRLQRERLVQRRQRHVARQVGQHAGIDPRGLEVAAAAVHHAMRDRGEASAVQSRAHALQDQRQRRAVGVCLVERNRERRNAAFAEVGRRPADALHLAVPQRLARQRRGGRVEQRELDARRAAVEDQDQGRHGDGRLRAGWCGSGAPASARWRTRRAASGANRSGW